MRRTTRAVAVLACVTGSLLVAGPPASAALGDPSSGPSGPGAMSADGRYIAFVSGADNLLDGDPTLDTNGYEDVFVLDTVTGEIEIVSRAGNVESDGDATEVDISADGRYVAFVSEATNLLGIDQNGSDSDVFVADRTAGTLTLASRRGASGAQGNAASWNVSISNDGTAVAFTSYATNLVGVDTNGVVDAFVRDLSAGTTTRVSTTSNGKQANGPTQYVGISGNGSVVGFASTASNLVNSDTNGVRDVYVKTLASDKTQRVSLTNGDKQAKGTSTFYGLSNNGKVVAFASDAANLVAGDTNARADAFIRDRTGGTTLRVSRRGSTEANGESYAVAISNDGAYVAFTTNATNLGTGTDENGVLADVYEFEVATKALRHVSVDADGGWADGASYHPLYGPSSTIVFTSAATDLVAADLDGVDDVFTRDFGETRDDASTTLRSLPAPTA
jgi:Tol biopolymer transport system component